MEFVNLTSHTINLPGMAIPPSGTVARAAATDTPIGDIDGIPVITTTYGGIQDLPDHVEGTVYIASVLAAQAVKGMRSDVFAPAQLVRDEQCRVIGANALARI
mgnify:FL=1